MTGSVVDISVYGLVFRHRPVTSASPELVTASGEDLGKLCEDIAEQFGPGAQWCEVGHDLHTVTSGSVETRLRLQPETCTWHADFFDVGWLNEPFDAVPPEYRAEVAAYVDLARSLWQGLVRASALRQAAAEGGIPAVNRLVHGEFDRLDAWFAALDTLHTALQGAGEQPPPWAYRLVREELQWLNSAREWLLSASAEFCWGRSGPRPDTLFEGLRYIFTTGWVDLMRPTQPGPAARAFLDLIDARDDSCEKKRPDGLPAALQDA
ncbi:hypothetical protein ABZ502_17235 [Streptomyces abikoensis]|uniref:hypothetical protein n=1 Tax=Streptomyces abikoensis TaxID=97398 RepID=UPI00340AA533